jgi:hypothetical protein
MPTLGTSAPNIRRIPLQKFDVPGTNRETIIRIAEITANASMGAIRIRASSPATCSRASWGQPDRILKPDQSYQIPVGAVHDARAGANRRQGRRHLGG